MEHIIVKISTRKRLSKKIKQNYYIIEPGEFLSLTTQSGESITLSTSGYNLGKVYIGENRRKKDERDQSSKPSP